MNNKTYLSNLVVISSPDEGLVRRFFNNVCSLQEDLENLTMPIGKFVSLMKEGTEDPTLSELDKASQIIRSLMAPIDVQRSEIVSGVEQRVFQMTTGLLLQYHLNSSENLVTLKLTLQAMEFVDKCRNKTLVVVSK